MTSLVDLFLYEIARAHQQELLESAWASRALAASEPTSFAGMLRAFGIRLRRRMAPSPTAPPVDAIGHADPVNARARKDAA
ncbi:MAG TPA: hypothetical protein VKB87_09620 [Myxococcaceae bacterium]|nr:hypothetical protein [Myxococcaceae bacterium]